jgi:hypothetical protein
MKIYKPIRKFKVIITHKDCEQMLDFNALISKELNIDGKQYNLKISLEKCQI